MEKPTKSEETGHLAHNADSKKKPAIYSIPWPLYAAMLIVVLACIYLNVVPFSLPAALAVLLVLSAVLGEAGDRIPIWNEYIGGGAILAFLVGGLIYTYEWMPRQTIDLVIHFFDEFGYLDLFVSVLITGSVLAINRKLLLRALTGYFPAIIGGIAMASVCGVLAGLLFGKSPVEILTLYMLPIMGGGTGAGAIPMAEIYASATGESAEKFLSFALPILTIANILCIFTASVLNKIGNVKPGWTGNGELLKGNMDFNADQPEEKVELKLGDIGAGLALACTFYMMGTLFSKVLLPTILGVKIHTYAYMIVFVALSNVFNLIPANMKQGAKRLQSFFGSNLLWLQMLAVGMALTNFNEMLSALTIPNVIIAGLIVIGAFIGSAVVGWLVGFYPIEAGISAGLCMANRGGSGDIAVLGASKRMSLISYAQISSRLGGAIILVIASIMFGMFLG
ncbi:2-hydroxycarboxylate transporter family protein [Clostridium sp. AM58-1XD]|uniref:2-hydroxycarboxylate transporter family protein n=1 Tax=Clostridium sp. AM58-1XD TaxID=2292307 RepID=UPI0015F52754|nr:2-hydroxycarboxylate transporter family protein [Clostridium sp. AM58-1XD]